MSLYAGIRFMQQVKMYGFQCLDSLTAYSKSILGMVQTLITNVAKTMIDAARNIASKELKV